MRHIQRLFFSSILMFSLIFSFPPPAQSSQNKILIGIMPEFNVFKQKQRFKLLGEYLSKKTGVKVEFTILSRYGNIVERFTSEKMDGAFFGSFTGALAIRKLGVVPLVRPVNLDGSSTYHGYLFARKDSGIKSVQDMKNKRMAFVDKATTAGYIFPLAYLRENGITDTDHFFSESFFTGSHDAAIKAVLDRKADIGAAKNTVFDLEKMNDPRVGSELIVLAKSSNVPSNGLCVRRDLNVSLKNKIKSVLLSLHTDSEGSVALKQFGALRFVETTAGEYQPVLDMLKISGINLLKYDYNNK